MKPAIHVYYCCRIKDVLCMKQLLLGIEEEGVPCHVEAHGESTALELSYKAAESSSLGVGIGVGEDVEAVLHYNKLKRDEPLFRICLKSGELQLRALGANAARLVKGVPFKDISEKEAAEEPDKEIKHLTALIINRIKDLLHDKGGAGFA